MSLGAAETFGIALMALWGTAGAVALGRSVAKTPAARELAAAVRKMNLAAKGVLVAGLVGLVAVGGTKPGGTNDPPLGLRSPPATVAVEPSFAPVEVRTNNVAFRAESASAVEMKDWRKHGSSSGGVWLDFDEPVFRIGTNPVFRAHVAASGVLSFDSMRRPPVGAPLPDGTGLPALAPLLAPLGMVPEANWTSAGAASRFWHDAAPGRGRVLAWEEALLDRQPGRRVFVQAELLPSGDFTYRYDFSDALDPPATNLVIGGQIGTNGVNALAILGSNTLAVTVWRVDGARVTNGVSIADLLCTNGVLRTPTRFAIEWKNTTGIDPTADTDGDGLSDGDEVFLYGTDPRQADTDGDGLSDMAEVLAGADPLDADENGDGVPDGITPADWASHPLWATNSSDHVALTIALLEDLPTNATATLVLDTLSIPLRTASRWIVGIERGEFVNYRLFVSPGASATLDLTAEEPANDPQRSATSLRDSASWGTPLWKNGTGGVFDGPSSGGSGQLAIPTLDLLWNGAATPCSHETGLGICLHGTDAAIFDPQLRPPVTDMLALENFSYRNGELELSVPESGELRAGTVSVPPEVLWSGALSASAIVHRADATPMHPYCFVCGHYEPEDAALNISGATLTLKHDCERFLSVVHTNSPEVVYENECFEIRRKGDSEWFELGSLPDVSPWTARIAGRFELRGFAEANGRSLETPVMEVEVQFPSIDDIIADETVQSRALEEWQATLDDCTEIPNRRREHAYWLFLNTRTNGYESGIVIPGPWVAPGTNGSARIGFAPVDDYPCPDPNAEGATYCVAWFHTHTPTTFITNAAGQTRPVGPSIPTDYSNAVLTARPGIAYDYLPAPGLTRTNSIPMGWPEDAPATLYPISPPVRRETP